MAKIADILGINKLKSWFNQLKKAAQKPIPSVVVGYTAAYAIYVHERVEMKWKGLPRGQGFYIDKRGRVVVPNKILTSGKASGKNRGYYWDPLGRAQAKFLEQPAREMQQELGRVVAEVTKNTGKIEDGLLAAGLRLQRESMLLVPVDTGNLKNSAFTRVEP